ncbi:rho-related BTB domain-containing protein 1-like [Gigantopelta aegis]|uniref:rho-related BTB domain-containing protein 1-like n=1 Tax=Gigantopelta aegis TaxID=1735272 RepID=UPI001B889E5B|nr:rho-related BTB domain-containing protein 1-like [Gigantopelta aegis]
MVNQQQGQNEIIKCVLVGDSGVGKTCLVCAWACNAKYDLKSLVKSHAATVWATDHYRYDKEVLDRSWCEVDGVRVSLRLWDTFGYHDKDRRFAYRGADVIAICFSTVRPNSLQNIKKIWYPEIRRFCPTTPIVLVGTQVDLRFLHKDDDYMSMQKGLLYKPIGEKDVITPELGRDVAKDIGAPYYETSVLTHHGVEDVFINSIRAFLIESRKIKFWNAQLRKVQRPLIQPPMMMPRPPLPKVTVPPATLHDDLSQLLYNQAEGDVVFVIHALCIRAHKICLMVASEFFEELFSLEPLSILHRQKKVTQPVRTRAPSDPRHHDEERLLESDQESVTMTDSDASERPTVYVNDIELTEPYETYPVTVPYSHPAVKSVEIKYIMDPFDPTLHQLQTVVTMCDGVTPSAFQHVLDFLYTGVVKEHYDTWDEVRVAASLLNITDMLVMMSNMTSNEEFLNEALRREFHEARCVKLRRLALQRELLTDITFKLDDGLVSAHKPLLMARCEMMFAMFNSDFVESSAEMVSFPGINCDTFRALREYLYTAEQSDMTGVDCIQLIEVANRLCLPRLVSLTELFIVKELLKAEKDEEEDVLEEILLILEPAELHNASQLAKWCRRYLALHYKEIHQKHGKLLKGLHKENLDFIENNRWPPVWYLKDLDHYERVSQHLSRCEQRQVQDFNRWLRCSAGCLCFSRRGRARFNRDESIEMPI